VTGAGRWLAAALALAAAPAWGAPPQRIADLWFAHNAATIMLGAGDRIVVTTDSPSAQPWMYRIAPSLGRAQVVVANPANAEALLAAGVEVAFVGQGAEAERLTRLGIPTRAVPITDAASLRANLRDTADAIGTPQARARLKAYDAFLDGVLARLQRGLKGVPDKDRPRVLHLGSLTPLRADGGGTLIDDWITLAGGRNVAAELKGTLKPVSVEQIDRWNPDIIIVGGQDERPDEHPLATMPELAGRRVVRNPSGVYQWDRHGPEFALQLLWAAKQLHPKEFADVDMVRETTDFYRRLYGYPMKAGEARLMLAAEPPPAK
jgi:iron complex transport system substrate-binding protein